MKVPRLLRRVLNRLRPQGTMAELPASLRRELTETDVEPLEDLPPRLVRAGLIASTKLHYAIAGHHRRHRATRDLVYRVALHTTLQHLDLSRVESRVSLRLVRLFCTAIRGERDVLLPDERRILEAACFSVDARFEPPSPTSVETTSSPASSSIEGHLS